jgi:hypothetical protein
MPSHRLTIKSEHGAVTRVDMFRGSLFGNVVFRHIPEINRGFGILLAAKRGPMLAKWLFLLLCSLEVERLGQLSRLTIEIERVISRCGRQISAEMLIRSDTLRACQIPALRKRWQRLAGRLFMPSFAHCLLFGLPFRRGELRE